jgi:hypothetical protein
MDNASPPKPELRREYRRQLQVPLTAVDETGQRLDGRTADVSASGLGCVLSNQMLTGAVLLISFSLPTRPGGQVVHARARVMYSTLQPGGFRTGLVWAEIAEETHQTIRAFARPAAPLRL